MTTLVGGVLVGVGVALVILAGLGIVTLPDLFSRMHAGSKTTSLGLLLVFVGAAVLHGTWQAGVKLGLAGVFLLVTQPVAVHVLSRAAHRAGIEVWEGTLWDELRERYPPEGGEPDRADG
jgi:multicomponent Na+:H+ antiporter subunit G